MTRDTEARVGSVTLPAKRLDELRMAEYHRGYVDGQRQRDADEWALDAERRRVVAMLCKAEIMPYPDVLATMGGLMSAVTYPRVVGLNYEDDFECFRTRLIHLLGGDIGKEGAR